MTRKEVRGLSTSPASGPSPAHSTVWRSRPMSSYNIVVIRPNKPKKSRVRQVQLTKPKPTTSPKHHRPPSQTLGRSRTRRKKYYKKERKKRKGSTGIFPHPEGGSKNPHTDSVCILYLPWYQVLYRVSAVGALWKHNPERFLFLFLPLRTVQDNLLFTMPKAQNTYSTLSPTVLLSTVPPQKQESGR